MVISNHNLPATKVLAEYGEKRYKQKGCKILTILYGSNELLNIKPTRPNVSEKPILQNTGRRGGREHDK